MSNRRRPRRPDLSLQVVSVVEDVPTALRIASAYRCPDCHSTRTAPQQVGTQVVRVEILHDPTCPWLARWTA